MNVSIRRATPSDLEKLWAYNIASHPDDEHWVRWRAEYILMNQDRRCRTYCVCIDDEPVGEGTLLFHPSCKAVSGRPQLADGHSVANINALRIRKAFEGQGHISRLIRFMEDDARANGMRTLTIGVEAAQARTLAIYLHLGYQTLVYHETEDGELILYYSKEL